MPLQNEIGAEIMSEQQPPYDTLISRIGLKIPLIGMYDAPHPEAFIPLTTPQPGECVFAFYREWISGRTLHLTSNRFGCGGCGRWMFGAQTRTQEEFIKFLVDGEGLKASRELMAQWIEASRPYRRSHPHILIGPLKADRWASLKTVTFFVDPDQLSALVYGTQYHSAPGDPVPLIAPFGSGCMQLVPFRDPEIPQAALGATDVAMRHYLPPDILAITVTRPMFERLCALDERSFLYKPFLQNLWKARGRT
jgi:hypothetical protein